MLFRSLKRGASPEQAEELRCWIRCHNLEVQTTRGENQAVLVVIGDASRLDESYIEDMEIVEYVRAITQPYKLSGRNSPDDASIIDVGGVKIGGGTFTMIAGPCSVESAEQIVGMVEKIVYKLLAHILKIRKMRIKGTAADIGAL